MVPKAKQSSAFPKGKPKPSVAFPMGKAKMGKPMAYEMTGESRERALSVAASRKIFKYESGVFGNFRRLVKGIASIVLMAYLVFRDPKKRRREYLIPKDKSAWLEWLVHVARKRIDVEYLTEKELRKVIVRARPNLSPQKKAHQKIIDHDLPACLEWNENTVGDWIVSIGYPLLKETFVKNFITGRRLALIDCTALNKMGMTDLAEMRDVARKIRELLGTPSPNALRPIMRVAPFERFLGRKVYNGRNYDDLTFEKFCQIENYNYALIADNKNALIPCTCEVVITTPEQAEVDEDGAGDDDDEEHSLKNAPTVEFLVRNAIVRNKTVDQIMQDILDNVFLPPRERKYGKEVWGTLKRGLGEGYDDLHLSYPKDRLEFASGVAHHLIDELYKTVAILNDISQLQKNIDENIPQEEMKLFQDAATILMEEAAPIASLLALGELNLEAIFRSEPTFQLLVDDVIEKAQRMTNELVPAASSFVDDVISEAWRKIPDMDLKELNPELRHSILKMANEVLHGIAEDKDDIVDAVIKSHAGNEDTKRGAGSLSHKVTVKEKLSKPAKQPQQTQAKTKQPPTKPGKKQSVPDGKEANDEALHTPPEPATAEGEEDKKSVDEGQLAGTKEESGSLNGDNPTPGAENRRSTDATEPTKQGKGKGKKQKKEEQAPVGGGEGVADIIAPEDGQELDTSQNFTVQTAKVVLNNSRPPLKAERPHSDLEHSIPVTPIVLRLTTAERRDSPLHRSPLTVSTPTGGSRRNSPSPRSPLGPTTHANVLSATEGKKRAASFASSDDELAVTSKPITPLANKAIVLPKATDGHVRPATFPKPVVPKVKTTIRSSKERDRLIKPLLNAADERTKSASVDGPPGQLHPTEGIIHRQGKTVPPSQQIYNQQLSVQRKQQQPHIQHPSPTTYHHKSGAITGGAIGTKVTFGSVHEAESLPPLHQRPREDDYVSAQKAARKSNFVLIPKHLKHGQGKNLDTHAQDQQPQPNNNKSPTTPKPIQITNSANNNNNYFEDIRAQGPPPQKSQPIDSKSLTTPKPIQVARSGSNNNYYFQKTEQNYPKSGSLEFDSAKEIWNQLKEQFQSRKAEQKMGSSSDKLEDFSRNDQKLKRSTLLSSNPGLIIDSQHVLEMKEHRELMVEDWAKKHSIMDYNNPDVDKAERARLVRMTADKVVTEVCTMALTHLLLEAEAGKNTQRIMDTLRRLETSTDSQDDGIMLWESTVGKASRYQKAGQSVVRVRKNEPRKSILSPEQQRDGTQERRPIIQVGGGGVPTEPGGSAADKLRTQAKSVVVNAVKGALEESGRSKSKPLTRSTPTSDEKDYYVTRL